MLGFFFVHAGMMVANIEENVCTENYFIVEINSTFMYPVCTLSIHVLSKQTEHPD